jgi:hypothetical protein
MLKKRDGQLIPILGKGSDIDANNVVFDDGKNLEEKIVSGEIGGNIKVGDVSTVTADTDTPAAVTVALDQNGEVDFKFTIPKGGTGSSPYSVQIISTNGDKFKTGQITSTTLYAYVYSGLDDVTGLLDASCFKWSRKSDDPDADYQWNSAHTAGSKSITLTDNDVQNRAIFECDIIL